MSVLDIDIILRPVSASERVFPGWSLPMTTASAHPVAQSIAPVVRMVRGYYMHLLDGVTPETFARRPEGVVSNHPAFILGHVAFYSNRIMNALGVETDYFTDGSSEIYVMDAECVDAADGALYHPMAESVKLFGDVMDTVIETLPTVDSSAFERDSTGTPFADVIPTMGGVANFVLVAHPMMHAGQFSAWRRCMGHGPSKLL